MSEMRQTIQKDEQIDIDRAFWGSVILTVVGITSFVLGLFMIARDSVWQVYGVGLVATASMLINIACVVLIRRGQAAFSLKLLFLSGLVTITLNTILLENVTTLLIGFMLLVSLGEIFFLFPKAWRNRALFGPFTATAVMLLVEFLNPSFRFNLKTVAPFFGQIMMAFMVVTFIIVVFRQTWGRSMRNKLLLAFIGVTVVATGALAVYAYTTSTSILQDSLDVQLTEHTTSIADEITDLIHEQVTTLTAVTLNEVLQQAVDESNHEYTGDAAAIQAELDDKDVQWRAADAADNNADPLVQEHLTNAIALEMIELQRVFPEHLELFVTDAYGGLAGTSNRTSDYYQADEDWWQAAYNNGDGAVYISQPEFDESTGKLGLQIAMPLKNRDSGELIGILRTTFDASEVATVLEEKLAQTDAVDIFFPGDTVTRFHAGGFETVESAVFEQISSITGQSMVEMDYEGVSSVVVSAPVVSQEGNRAADQLGWIVVFYQERDEAFAPVNTGIRGVVVVASIVVAMAAIAAFVLALILVRPITKLTQTAEEIAGGNIDTQAEVASDDEVGTLARAFNTMTAQLREFIGTLEERVEARTKDQATVANIATEVGNIQNLDEMLARMVHLTQRGFGLYHAHVFLYEEGTEELRIVACGYKEGDEHEGTHGTTSIPLAQEQSLVARAGRERNPVIVNDVRSDPGWLPNPLLPDTKAEMAVPMLIGGKLLGVLDVQADQMDAFDDADATIQLTLAAQVAVAVQNILQFQTSLKMAADLGVVTEVGIAAATISDANQLLQEVVDLSKESFNLYHAHIYLMDEAGETLKLASGAGEVGRQMVSEGRSIPLDSEKSLVARAARTHEGVVVNDVRTDPDFLPNPLLPETRAEMAVPMLMGGRVLGVLDVQSETVGRFTQIDINIKTTLASQIAVALENARSFRETQKQAERESKLNLITQKIQGAATIEEAMQVAARELGHALGKRQTLVALNPSVLAGDGGKKVVNE